MDTHFQALIVDIKDKVAKTLLFDNYAFSLAANLLKNLSYLKVPYFS